MRQSRPSGGSGKDVNELAARFADKSAFMKAYNVSLMPRFCAHSVRCVMGTAPTIGCVARSYGEDLAATCVVPFLHDLCAYCSARSKLTAWQYVQLARTICVTYHYLKVTEVMLFFHMVKQGRLLRYYGTVDPMAVMDALRRFVAVRNGIIDEQERKKRAAEDKAARDNAITYEEYLRRKGQGG